MEFGLLVYSAWSDVVMRKIKHFGTCVIFCRAICASSLWYQPVDRTTNELSRDVISAPSHSVFLFYRSIMFGTIYLTFYTDLAKKNNAYYLGHVKKPQWWWLWSLWRAAAKLSLQVASPSACLSVCITLPVSRKQ